MNDPGKTRSAGEAGEPATAMAGRRAPGEAPPRIPDYDLLRKIGQGGYGEVWLARGLTGAYCAVKIVWRNRFSESEPFEREFRGLKESVGAVAGQGGGLALLHVGRDEAAGFFYYVMELADDAGRGRSIDPAGYVPLTLKELRRRRGRLPAAECRKLGETLARELAALHARGLVHRDIKPSNIILVNGAAKLADIGLVASVSEARTFVGTEGFVPPEGPGTPAADVFALGKVLYELATGFDRQDYPKLPPALADRAEQAALFELNEILLRACDANPDARYRDGAALLADFAALARGQSLRNRQAGKNLRRAAAAAVVLIAGGFAGWKWFGPAKPAVENPAGAAAPAAAAPTIAVLPFAPAGATEEDRLWAEGIDEEVRTALAKISTLKVLGRAAGRRHADPRQRDLRAIAAELGVDTVIEGAVKRTGERVSIAVQVVDARSLREVWSGAYQPEASAGFAIEAAIAGDVARALGATLTSDERSRVERPPTAHPIAYDSYVKARLRYLEIGTVNGSPRAEIDAIVRLLGEAVEADPAFVAAYALLARVHADAYFYGYVDQTPERRELARQAVAAAVRLAPQAAETRFAQGRFLYACERNFPAALEHYRAASAGLPNDVELLIQLSAVYRRVGRFAESVAVAERALALNPTDLTAAVLAVQTYRMMGRYAQAVAIGDRFPGVGTNHAQIRLETTLARFELDGDRERLARDLRASPRYGFDPKGLQFALFAAWLTGDLEEAARIAGDPRYPETAGLDGVIVAPPAMTRAEVAAFRGDMAAAVKHAEEALAFFAAREWSPAQQPLVKLYRMRAAAYRGSVAEARELGVQVRRELLGKDAVNDSNILDWLWHVYLLIGAHDEALAVMRQSIAMGLPPSPRLTRLGPEWQRVAGDPRFEALVPLPATGGGMPPAR